MMCKSLRIFLFLLLCLLASCGDDDTVLPAYRQELVELQTDASGNIQAVVLDNGQKFGLNNHVGGLVPDTLYRAIALFVEEESNLTLHAARRVISPFPVSAQEMEIVTDPLELKAMWNSPRYLNLLVGIKTGGKEQHFSFVQQGVVEIPGGGHKLCLQLSHEQLEDPLYYTQELYLSCPLYGFTQNWIHGRDSIQMEVMTFEGIVRKTFPF